ncbi:MAG: hypothetical protein IID37_04825, partial [Planctomycetes bacterium]|nr:hypothetical protein [Planctomycetota bacterium]
MHTMQAANTTTIPIRKEAGPAPATGVARRHGQAFEQLLALTADGYLQSFAQEIRSLVPGDTSASSGRGNAHARRLSVLQAEDAQSAMGMRASELSGLTPRGQRLGAQRAELARSAASGTSSDDSRAGGGGTRETPAETNQLNGPKTRAISAAAASDQLAKATLSNGGAGQSRSDPSASRPFSNDLNGAA